ncbi:hypothetical protein Poli38472_011215 [Pythium oligandrum]|uniref:Uncharacterized protein n=1 Tax=Pythium oligandrum TaxID=41045 RepID=A0A8K1CRV6_PYTOL|nr:hypothetical protein Poli38472_011215 [Pythium oligandrum]|eukprot:TMW67595.1 hypothetical protein Poli38472_011215 [Pythium oligandrum]
MSVFRCDRGGKQTNWRKLDETTRKRHRPSRRIGCPMRIKLVSMDFYDARGEWKIEYTPDGSALQNHPPDERRRQREATATIDLTEDGCESDASSDNESIDLSLD